MGQSGHDIFNRYSNLYGRSFAPIVSFLCRKNGKILVPLHIKWLHISLQFHFLTCFWDAERQKLIILYNKMATTIFWFMHLFEWRRIIYIHYHIVHPFKSFNTTAQTDPQQPSNYIQDICSCWVIWCLRMYFNFFCIASVNYPALHIYSHPHLEAALYSRSLIF